MPDAPQPRYTAEGAVLNDWLVVAKHDAAQQALTLSWHQEGSLWRRTKRGAIGYPEADVDDLVEGFVTTVQMLHHPSLF